MFGLNMLNILMLEDTKYRPLHKYMTSLYCSLCSLHHMCMYMLSLSSTYKWLYECLIHKDFYLCDLGLFSLLTRREAMNKL